MNKELFFESIEKIGLTKDQINAIRKLHAACFEGYEKNLVVPSSIAVDHNIYDSIKGSIVPGNSHSNDNYSYTNPMTLANDPNAVRDYAKEVKDDFKPVSYFKRRHMKSDAKTRELMKIANKHLPTGGPVDAVGTSMMPMVTGFAAPNRMNYSPYTQGCAVGGYSTSSDGGGGTSGGGSPS